MAVSRVAAPAPAWIRPRREQWGPATPTALPSLPSSAVDDCMEGHGTCLALHSPCYGKISGLQRKSGSKHAVSNVSAMFDAICKAVAMAMSRCESLPSWLLVAPGYIIQAAHLSSNGARSVRGEVCGAIRQLVKACGRLDLASQTVWEEHSLCLAAAMPSVASEK